jgi:hypothetical protein
MWEPSLTAFRRFNICDRTAKCRIFKPHGEETSLAFIICEYMQLHCFITLFTDIEFLLEEVERMTMKLIIVHIASENDFIFACLLFLVRVPHAECT